MRSPIVTTPSPPEPTIAIVRSFVGIGTLSSLSGVRVSAKSADSVRERRNPRLMQIHHWPSPSARSEGETAREIGRVLRVRVFAAFGVEDVAGVEVAARDRFEGFGQGFDVGDRVEETEARAHRARDRRAVAREDALLHSPALGFRDVQEGLDVGVRAEAAVARADAPFAGKHGGGQGVWDAVDVEGNDSQPRGGVGGARIAVEDQPGNRRKTFERRGGQIRLVPEDSLPADFLQGADGAGERDNADDVRRPGLLPIREVGPVGAFETHDVHRAAADDVRVARLERSATPDRTPTPNGAYI